MMDNFNEIKNLWQNHKTEHLPSILAINDAIKSYHSRKKRHIIFLVFMSIIFVVVWIFVIINYNSNLWTTRAGEGIFVAMSLYLFISKLRLLRKNKQEELMTTNNYLEDLKKKSIQKSIQKKRLVLFLMGALALSFYMYEVLYITSIRLITGYTILFLYVTFIWFIYRPYKIKRQQKKTQHLLTKIDNIKKQTNEKND